MDHEGHEPQLSSFWLTGDLAEQLNRVQWPQEHAPSPSPLRPAEGDGTERGGIWAGAGLDTCLSGAQGHMGSVTTEAVTSWLSEPGTPSSLKIL